MVYLDAIKLGVDTVCTAVPPLANAPSQPSIFNIASNLRYLGYEPLVDEGFLKPVSAHFESIARREGLPMEDRSNMTNTSIFTKYPAA